MSVEVRAARSGDGHGLARIWLDNARYYVALFPDDFREPDEAGLVEWFETLLRRPRAESELHLVAVANGEITAFVYARLTEPDEHANRQMLADYPSPGTCGGAWDGGCLPAARARNAACRGR
jgi:hypothetical protein